jgi:hypothetical protein
MTAGRLFLQHNQFYLLRFSILFVFLLLVVSPGMAQTATDSVVQIDVDSTQRVDQSIVVDTTAYVESDSVCRKPEDMKSKWQLDPSLPFSVQILKRHPYFHFDIASTAVYTKLKEFKSKDILFYALAGMVLFFSMFRLVFSKYFNDLLRVFFRTTLKQRQIKEQLMQTPLPSFAFNFFFVGSAGLYIDFLFQYFNIRPVNNFWLLYLYCCTGLSIIYLVKFIALKLCGWLFNMRSAADSYIFIVFIINKVIGIFLLPVNILLAFMDEPFFSSVLVLSWVGIGVLFLYRFILGYSAIRKEVRFNLFHFFLYLCAFEIAPLLLIYRLLLLNF